MQLTIHTTGIEISTGRNGRIRAELDDVKIADLVSHLGDSELAELEQAIVAEWRERREAACHSTT